jgi:hypothetical protein
MWQYIQDIIDSKLSRDMDKLYDKPNQKLNTLTRGTKRHTSKGEHKERADGRAEKREQGNKPN